MTQEEKQLLLIDLCARLLYGVQGITSEGVISPLITKGEADWDILTSLNYRIVKHEWKPYLRPMSSMTEEEEWKYNYIKENHTNWEAYDYLNSIHIDYRDLIPKGLALEAPKDMYNTKN